jgi:hypothetical protein
MSKFAENVIRMTYPVLLLVVMSCAYIASLVFSEPVFWGDCDEKVQEETLGMLMGSSMLNPQRRDLRKIHR